VERKRVMGTVLFLLIWIVFVAPFIPVGGLPMLTVAAFLLVMIPVAIWTLPWRR
jgi:hypothetical protein